MEINLFDYVVIKPLAFLGITHSFFDINLDIIIATWIGILFLLGFGFLGKYYLEKNPLSMISIVLEEAVRFFADLCSESVGGFKYEYFSFISSIFFFTLACNVVAVLPFVEEPTKDLNTTLAITLSSFFYTQYQHIRHCGFYKYLKSYTEPIFFLLPLEIIGKFASIVSMSFRLFGNILGGSIIFMLIVQVVGFYKEAFMIFAIVILGLHSVLLRYIDLTAHKQIRKIFSLMFLIIFFLAGAQMFFGLFEAVVQAFVITMLSLTYLSMAISEPVEE